MTVDLMGEQSRCERRAPVTVIIPAYNEEAYLAQAVQSAQAQTMAPEEIIVVNDGSSDRTAEIAGQLGVTVFSQENKGLPAARNSGIKLAKSKWIAFLDSDDIWEPDKLECQLAAVDVFPEAGFVATDYCQFNNQGEIVHASFLSQAGRFECADKESLGGGVSVIREPGHNFIKGGYFLVPSVIMIRRSVIEYSGLFDETLRYVEDLEFFLRVLRYTPILMVEQPLLRYRVHSSNMSSNRLKMSLGVLAAVDRILASPGSYAAGAVAYARQLEKRNIPIAGRELIEEGQFIEARKVLGRRFGVTMGLRPFIFWVVTLLGATPFNIALSLKRKFLRGG